MDASVETSEMHVLRCYLYQLMKALYGSEPNAELLAAVLSDGTYMALEHVLLAFGCDREAACGELGFMSKLKQMFEDDADHLLDRIKNEYTRLFIGPQSLPAPPWESVYKSKERLLFNADTLAVREAYLKRGLLPSGYPNEADDHLSTELDFMFLMADEMRELFESGKDSGEQISDLVKSQLLFLEEHLLTWVSQFAKDIQKSESMLMYPQMANLLHVFLAEDARALRSI